MRMATDVHALMRAALTAEHVATNLARTRDAAVLANAAARLTSLAQPVAFVRTMRVRCQRDRIEWHYMRVHVLHAYVRACVRACVCVCVCVCVFLYEGSPG